VAYILYAILYIIYVRYDMKRPRVNEDIRPMSEFRTGIAGFLKQIHDTKRPLIITQHGKGVAVLLDAGEYEAMQERIELLQDIQTSISQIGSGQGIEHEQARSTALKRIRR
jgi:prevent-host-death family protein